MSKYKSPDAHSSDGISNSPQERPKKKKRTLGSFPCPVCSKVFTRSDHLARHHLNHEPKELFECDAIVEDYEGNRRKCGKTFVRRDLKERHAKRHMDGSTKGYSKTVRSSTSRTSKGSVSLQTSAGDSPVINPNHQQSPLQISNLVNEMHPTENVHNAVGYNLAHVNNGSNNPIGNPINLAKTPRFSQQEANNFNGIHYVQSHSNMMPPPMQDLYIDQNRQAMKLGNNFPQSQNDILSWLFTESPENMIVTPGSDQLRSETLKGMNPAIEPSPGGVHSHVPYNNNGNNHIPSPLGGSQFSPITDQIQQQQIQQHRSNNANIARSNGSQLQIPFPANQYREEPLAPFYHNDNQNLPFNVQSLNHYGMQDVNIFSNDDNPLDEVFLKNYQAQSVNGSEPLASFNFRFNSSTGSSSSPTTTNESTSPVLSSDTQNSPSVNESSRRSTIASLQNHFMPDKNNIEKNKNIYIDSRIADNLIESLPTISRDMLDKIFEQQDESVQIYSLENRLSYYLSIYWSIFHPQYSILHRPSFNTTTAEPLLLWPMIIIGCNYSRSSGIIDIKRRLTKKSSEFKFAICIITPLRFMIFQHDDFKSPVKLWILQSLNILEWCEKNFLLRGLHERGHIHHGTTVQLLRRSPLLGGNPATTNKRPSLTSGSNTSADESDTPNDMTESNDTTDYDLFIKWVESESMKRITFMTFYLDIIDYIKFRHNPQIMFYQLQLLNLPCDDHLWESTEVNGSFRKIVKRQKKLQKVSTERHNMDPIRKRKDMNTNGSIKIRSGESFLNVLKKLLKPYKSPTNRETKTEFNLSLFTTKILFAGLVSIMYQMQQTDLQNNSSLLGSAIVGNKSQAYVLWKDILSKALDNWHFEINGNCCSEIFKTPANISDCIIKSQCQFPMYHLTQIIGMADINHYDIAIFGGSPANMSVSATMKDQFIVQNKLNNMWLKNSQNPKRSINDLVNLKSIVHSYLLLWETMLKPLNLSEKSSNIEYLDWNVDDDYFDGMYGVGIATLVLWSYAFTTCGLESQRFNELNDVKKVSSEEYNELVELSAEGAYEYLHRIRQEFLTNLRKDNLHNEYSIHPFNLTNARHSAHEVIAKYCDLLPIISNKQNISGLCFFVGTKLLNSQWEIIRENGKLILNCGFRSIGKKNVLCLDLFDELTD